MYVSVHVYVCISSSSRLTKYLVVVCVCVLQFTTTIHEVCLLKMSTYKEENVKVKMHVHVLCTHVRVP